MLCFLDGGNSPPNVKSFSFVSLQTTPLTANDSAATKVDVVPPQITATSNTGIIKPGFEIGTIGREERR